ncbi:MAG: hypothetical protein LAT58_04450 [Opitutales bacterium]|nr:hypothetical protein [Opitutales bacterium]
MKPSLRTLILFLLVPVLFLLIGLQAWYVHNALERSILDGFDRKLLSVGSATARLIDGDLHERRQALPTEVDWQGDDFTEYFDSEDPYFIDHREILNELREATGLTYLYTQIHLGEDQIFYFLDGSPEEEWTVPGTRDTLPEGSTTAIRDVQAFGSSWVTGILDWDVWGLVKAGYYPLRNSDGDTVAMVGADVNVSIIQQKTRRALFAILFLGVPTLCLALVVVFRIASALTKPIEQIRYAALSLAAGTPPDEPLKTGVREVRQLAQKLTLLQDKVSRQQREALAMEVRLQKVRRNPHGIGSNGEVKKACAEKADSSPVSSLDPLFFLNTTPPFSRLPAMQLLILSQAVTQRSYPAGKVLCPAGYVPEYLFIPYKGSVVGTEGKPIAGFPGAASILSGQPNQETMETGPSGCHLLLLRRGKFLTLVEERPDLFHDLQGLSNNPST